MVPMAHRRVGDLRMEGIVVQLEHVLMTFECIRQQPYAFLLDVTVLYNICLYCRDAALCGLEGAGT